jgi:hypothetical protein
MAPFAGPAASAVSASRLLDMPYLLPRPACSTAAAAPEEVLRCSAADSS